MSTTGLLQQVKNVVKQMLYEKSGFREMKSSSALASLQSLILSPATLKEAKDDWKALVNEISAIFSSKAGQELKCGGARCIGLVGFMLDGEFEEFIRYIADKCKASKREEERSFLMRSIFESLVTYVNANKCLSGTAVKALMEFTKSYLDANDSPLELIPLLDICQLIAKYYSSDFKAHLHDVCDFVIGWFMDETQPKYVENKCREIIRSFGPIFVSDIQEAALFLLSLFDDCFCIVEQLSNPVDKSGAKDQTKLASAIPIIKVFAEIFQNSVTPANVHAIVGLVKKIMENLESKLESISQLSDPSVGLFYVKMCELLLLIHSVAPNELVLLRLRGLLENAFKHRTSGKADSISFIRLYVKVLASIGPTQKPAFVQLVLGQKSCLWEHPLQLMDKSVSLAFSAAFSELLDIGDLANLQTLYAAIAEDLSEKFKQLENSLTGVLFSELKKMEIYLITLMSSLRALTTAKNSIIVLRGLNPPLFSLLFNDLPLLENWLMTYFPACHYALLSLARNFSETHDHFVANSETFRQTQAASPFTFEGPTIKYFTRIVKVFSTLLDRMPALAQDNQTTIINWLDSASKSVKEMPKGMLRKKQMAEMQQALLMILTDTSIAKNAEMLNTLLAVAERFQAFALVSATKLNLAFIKKFISHLINKVGKLNGVQFEAIYGALPQAFLLGLFVHGVLDDLCEVEQEQLGKSQMAPFQFQMLTDFLVDKIAPSFLLNGNNSVDCVPIFALGLYNDLKEERIATQELSNRNRKFCFVVAQYALYCVENRMKTPIGKALETFTRFENEIREMVAMVASGALSEACKERVRCEWKMQKAAIQIDEEGENKAGDLQLGIAPRKLTRAEEFFRVRLLLEMIDSLDKLMVFAWHGSMFSTADISSGSTQFFQTNQASCQGWITRISLPLMSVCFSAGCFAQIVRLANFLFADLDQKFSIENRALKMDSSTSQSICWIVQALVELSAPQEIRGVHRWIRKVFELSIEWLDGAIKLASGRAEESLAIFSLALNEHSKWQDHVITAVEEMSLKAVSLLKNPTFSRQLCDSMRSIKKLVDSDKEGEENVNSIREFQLQSTIALSSWDSLDSISCYSASKPSDHCLPWELNKRLSQLEFNLLKVWLESAKNKYFGGRSELSSIGQELGEISQSVLSNGADKYNELMSKCTGLSLVVKMFNNGMEKQQQARVFTTGRNGAVSMPFASGINQSLLNAEFDVLSVFDSTEQNSNCQLATGQLLCSWIHRLNQSNAQQPLLRQIHSKMAKLAYRTNNANLAQFHLERSTNTNPMLFLENSSTPNQPHQAQFFNGPSIQMGLGFSPQLQPPRGVENDLIEQSLIEDVVLQLKMQWQQCSQTSQILNSRLFCFEHLAEAVCSQMERQQHPQYGGGQQSLTSRMCLRLGKWSRELDGVEEVIFHKHSTFPRLFFDQVLQTSEFLRDSCSGIDAASALKGSFFLIACGINSTVPKAHKAMADWAIAEIFANENRHEEEDVLKISEAEGLALAKLGINASGKEGKKLLGMIAQYSTVAELKVQVKSSSQFSDSFAILRSLSTTEFTQIWLLVKRRQFKLFEIALSSYVHFLESLSGAEPSMSVTSTIFRVLGLLSTQTDWFVKIIDDNWMDRINSDVWKDIIPQLFARLSHSSPVVRQTICRLLSKIGEVSPHAICFPSVVNCRLEAEPDRRLACGKGNSLSAQVDSTPATDEEEEEDEDEVSERQEDLATSGIDFNIRSQVVSKKNRSYLMDGCRSILSSLEKVHPQLVKDVFQFCSDLQKIQMLNEEKWLFVLSNLDHELANRLKQLENEEKKVALLCGHLSEEERLKVKDRKLELIMEMVLKMLVDLFDSTCSCQPQSANEKRFLSAHKSQISDAIQCFKANLMNPTTAWAPFKKLIESLNQRSMKRSSLCLPTQEISSNLLYSLASTYVPIPGQEFKQFSSAGCLDLNGQRLVTVQRMNKVSGKVLFIEREN